MKIAVIGDGGWGTTIAINLVNSGHDVRLWGAFPEYIEAMKKNRENVKFLPGVPIPDKLELVSDEKGAVKGRELIVIVVPSTHMREVLGRFKGCKLGGYKLISATKGIETDTLFRMSEVIFDCIGKAKLAVVSGPSIAYEVARGMPASVVTASTDSGLAKEAQCLLMTERLRVYTSSDVVGVELGGSLKNIVAIASGIADGLGFGANSKAAILTRGMHELTRLGVAMGAKKETFSGLSCMGDLITTCMSKHSRNRWLGEEIGKGKTARDVIGSTEMVVEGFTTTKSAFELGKKHDVDMPITAEMYEILYNGKEPKEAVRALMRRSPKDEIC